MTADMYQQAKAVFSELVDADAELRERRLGELRAEAPDLEREVRSLLEFHTAQSLIAPPSTPKIRTRSTLSTTYNSSPSLGGWLAWLWRLLPALPLLLLCPVVGYWALWQIERFQRQSLAAQLDESISSRIAQLKNWEERQVARALQWATHPQVAEPIESLVNSVRSVSPEDPRLAQQLAGSPCSSALSSQLAKLAGRPVKFAIWDRRMLTLADWNQRLHPELLGSSTTAAGANMLAPVLKGQPKLYLPHASYAISEGFQAEQGLAPLSILVPVHSSQTGAVVAAMMVRGYGLEEEYSEMLTGWTNVPRGEVYLISAGGELLTSSRYAERLSDLPLGQRKQGSRQRLLVRDPGGDLLAGYQPQQAPSSWLPTLLARQVAAGENGVSTEGYRNYVGRPVVGAWRWLADHGVGIAVEEDYASAFAVVRVARWAIGLLCGLFGVSLIGSLLVMSLRDRRQRLREISEVGPYQIQELLGEGGMGRVYLAEHALLCRQSAIKVLTKGDNELSVVSRFEREVQLASQLTHPNTIAIFDFGRSRDGVFYYAMEYINGAHLGQLVEYAGPLAPGRCILILQQLCRALREAHHAGVVHRDIKPQNIMVCNRGGEPDFVKLFDYGLVKAFAPGVSPNQSQTKIVVGTPRFMAPERLNSPWLADPRVDVYSVGALAYYLLTAQLPPLVNAAEDHHQEQPGVETLDLPPAVIEFGGLLSVCMSVEPASRPSNMTSVLRELEGLARKFPWTREDSEQWWSKHESKLLQLVGTKRKRLAPDGKELWKRRG